ncbi:MAG: single-stranded-DNA-specific exonuclease RecJ [Chromatiales bacterium 21-64-14]|nr:MAG: single-stranded-DNA-specific exonuclease RecJ [Chromatiales bacterium 21-64-14]HQU16552.1 single-stranded-DNA-specific exonuclease RecJ [Gammaproteobacteria bacterium]
MKARIARRSTESLAGLPAGLHPVLRRVYAARRVRGPADLEHSLERLHPLTGLTGIASAAALLSEAVEQDRRILLVGDFDADGATSCALAVLALRALGARQVHYLVPNRFEFGYGLTAEIVAVAADWHPDLIVTVDNGIASLEGVAAAHARGIQVLVTDHHLPGATLPAADAIVNPNLPGDPFPSKHLAGVGVIFYVLSAARAHLRAAGWFARRGIGEPKLAQFLDLVALGTVADVVPLDANNRILVQQGLLRIRSGQCRPGIAALLAVAKRGQSRVVAADLAFGVGPRLNAAGRLEDMSLGIECLITDDLDAAREMAQRLDELNHARRAIEAQMQTQALEVLEGLGLQDDDPALPMGLCLYDARWHPGVIGILAARIRERFHRPVIAFAPDGAGLKGSARSIPGLHIRDALDAVASRNPGLLSRFGGHAMAAGLSLALDRLEDFRTAFDDQVRRCLGPEDLEGICYTDGELAPAELHLETAQLLRDGGPWGAGFPEPCFDGEFQVLAQRVVGERHLKLTLRPAGGRQSIDGIAFQTPAPPVPWERVRIAYRLDVNEYQGVTSPQLLVEFIEPL